MEDFETQVKNFIGSMSNRQQESMMYGEDALEYDDDDGDYLIGFDMVMVEHFGGEDCGSSYYSVWKFESENGEELYVKFDGYYASHYGADYHNWYFVTPRQKTITEYV